jgi:hypothetical protein
MAVKFGTVVYKWKFLLAAVTFPLLGADFLRNFCLVVDLQYTRSLCIVEAASLFRWSHCRPAALLR